ncbi:MAG: sterol desaturase family protein [Flavobacteriales bacterium]|nr:sterol desaturase family protein [Flavobacteriales bacterium]
MSYLEIFGNKFTGMVSWIIDMVTFNVDWNQNWFYGLIIVSIVVWGLEIAFPWRKNQKFIRKDFWLDAFYMFFNFFIFAIILESVYILFETYFTAHGFPMNKIALFSELSPTWLIIVVFFVLSDFVQWFTHLLLHRYTFLWRFHKVHHSVQEMGFSAHLRYHWMENILYKPLKTLALMLVIGAQPEHAFFVHFFSITIGHLNHANVRITWGPLKYVFNNSVMHLYHHAKELPADRVKGVNFAISLSIWDYIFKKNYIPQDKDGGFDLGFEGIENYPKGFFGQLVSGFKK